MFHFSWDIDSFVCKKKDGNLTTNLYICKA